MINDCVINLVIDGTDFTDGGRTSGFISANSTAGVEC